MNHLTQSMWLEMHQAFFATIPLLSLSIYCQSPTLVSYCSSKLSLWVPFSSAASSAERTPRWFGCLFFLVTVAAISFFCLRSRITQKTPDLEQASVIALIALSTVLFVYFQFYHDIWSHGFHMVIFSLCGLWSISQFWQKPVLLRCVWDIVCYVNSWNSCKHMANCLSATHGLTFHYILIFQCYWQIGLHSTGSWKTQRQSILLY